MKNAPELKRILHTIIRIAIGWHFLYEGISKLLIENWTAENYLLNSTGPLASLFQHIAYNPSLLKLVDLLNIYGLILVGVALFIGVWVRWAAIAGTFMLTLYYFAYPPFGITSPDISYEHLFIVNRQFVEGMILLYYAILNPSGWAIENLLEGKFQFRKRNKEPVPKENLANSRREALKNLASLPVLGLLGWAGIARHRKYDVDVISGATIQVGGSSLKELKGEMPKGKIQDHAISRLVLGGNLIGGWAHSRDLLYVPSLFKAYNTEKKVYETLMLAEKAGINSINIGFPSNPLLAKYKKNFGSKIKVISQVGPNMDNGDYYEYINKAIDYGVDIIQVQGNWCDWLVRDKKQDVIVKMLEYIRDKGYTAGLASHTIDALVDCSDKGIIPDYYMKTMHHDNYWSAHPIENRVPYEVDGDRHPEHDRFHDNLFCLYPERTIEFVQNANIPVMGYKVLAAGAITPEDGFRWAFEHGADFICVGMFDFQIVDNVNTTLGILGDLPKRTREWYG